MADYGILPGDILVFPYLGTLEGTGASLKQPAYRGFTHIYLLSILYTCVDIYIYMSKYISGAFNMRSLKKLGRGLSVHANKLQAIRDCRLWSSRKKAAKYRLPNGIVLIVHNFRGGPL